MKRVTKAEVLKAVKVAVRMNPEPYLKSKTGWTCRARRKSYNSGRCTLERGHRGPHVCVWAYTWPELSIEFKGAWWSRDQKMKDYHEHISERMAAEGWDDDLPSDAEGVR